MSFKFKFKRKRSESSDTHLEMRKYHRQANTGLEIVSTGLTTTEEVHKSQNPHEGV